MTRDPGLKPDDFPIEADKDKLRTPQGRAGGLGRVGEDRGPDRRAAERACPPGRAGSLVGLGASPCNHPLCSAGMTRRMIEAGWLVKAGDRYELTPQAQQRIAPHAMSSG